MFSALKKLVGSEPVPPKDKNIPAGLQSMNQSLQRRFAKGVQYNMKIVIRGDRNTGKSTLWQRLQGQKFVEEYIPTQEIQVTSIHWSYKTTDDVVKVEVWDVVDKGQKYPLPEGVGKGKKKGDNLKLENEPQEQSDKEVALDAEFLDVYKNCNGVIMMFDITKQWTYNYILRELPKVPNHVPVCVLGNHRDMGEHRVVLPDDIRNFIADLNRPLGSSYIHYAESSMKNGFGLKYLHRFFNIPFLQLQRETLLRQLETNQLDIDATLEELCVQQETEDQNYEIFLEMMDSRGKGYSSPGRANGQSPSSGSQSPVVPPSRDSTDSSSPGTPQPPVPAQAQQSPPTSSPSSPPEPSSAAASPPPPADLQSPERPAPAPSPSSSSSSSTAPVAPVAAPPQKRGIISRLFGSSPAPEPPAAKPEPPAPVCPEKVHNVDDFVPDEGLDRSFLEESIPPKASVAPPPLAPLDSDSDGEGQGGNPMVAEFQDDLDLDDKEASLPLPSVSIPSKDLTLSSDEDESQPKVTVALDEDLEPELQNPLEDLSSLILHSQSTAPEAMPTLATHAEQIEMDSQAPEPAILMPSSAAALAQPANQSKRRVEKEAYALAESSDTDGDAPVAKQMLSYVMDDPDFESEESDTQKAAKESFPVRNDLSELSDDDFIPSKMPEPMKPTALSFKTKNENDLFGLGFVEKATKTKDSSDEQDVKERKHSTKEKKKKKKKSKEEEDKSSKKKQKHKKKEKDEAGTGDEKDKKKKKSRPKKSGNLDDLESFLAGGEESTKRDEGDYEEL
ncbi:rab-like protein 6 isoform X1 [Alosa sapidissima]|uniref:rab-like protein 6 isoform X1 n=1 Tax=Alosa sapidissima TaxID=34773 RepID=UPI001C0A1461|nr:rab-like protein 6 isoform X1 [Alosa sapidissima]XP_041958070.1 rab-like protein 6 isoform X1 [Alosa sapidissima]